MLLFLCNNAGALERSCLEPSQGSRVNASMKYLELFHFLLCKQGLKVLARWSDEGGALILTLGMTMHGMFYEIKKKFGFSYYLLMKNDCDAMVQFFP